MKLNDIQSLSQRRNDICMSYFKKAYTLLISRSQIDSKSGVNKKGTERLLFWSKFYFFFYSIFGVIFTP
jgi:hypothetical protein